MKAKLILIISISLTILVGYLFFQKSQSTTQTSTILLPTLLPTPLPFSGEIIPPITQDQLNNGWYRGNANQKKPGTPKDWIFREAGRSSCWHKPNNLCKFTPNMVR